MSDDPHTAFESEFSELYEKSLPEARAKEVEAHLAGCARCRAEYERFQSTLGALSGLNRVAAPPDFDDQVAATIHRRSAGRFFGRRAFGDRVPFELIALIALVAVVVAYWLIRGRG
jgi:anti-sigma factor RsiW